MGIFNYEVVLLDTYSLFKKLGTRNDDLKFGFYRLYWRI
jgi:hypothetical protein